MSSTSTWVCIKLDVQLPHFAGPSRAEYAHQFDKERTPFSAFYDGIPFENQLIMMTPLTSPEIAESLLAGLEPLWIFKHSNSCPVSLAAHDEVSEFLAAHAMPVGIVTVQEARPVSNWLATRLAYVHQSPQLFLIVAGKVVWHASHWGITAKAMSAALGTQRKSAGG